MSRQTTRVSGSDQVRSSVTHANSCTCLLHWSCVQSSTAIGLFRWGLANCSCGHNRISCPLCFLQCRLYLLEQGGDRICGCGLGTFKMIEIGHKLYLHTHTTPTYSESSQGEVLTQKLHSLIGTPLPIWSRFTLSVEA